LRAQNAAPLNRLLYVDLKTFLPCLNLDDDRQDVDGGESRSARAVPESRDDRDGRTHAAATETARAEAEVRSEASARRRVAEGCGLAEEGGVWGADRSWLRGPLRPLIAILLSEETVKRRGIFRPKEVKRVLDANFSGREDYNLQVFNLLRPRTLAPSLYD
jgi:hypothetical protein